MMRVGWCLARKVELGTGLLPNLEVLDLSHNGLCCLWGLHHLPRLAILDLGHNMVRSLHGAAGPRSWGGDVDCDDLGAAGDQGADVEQQLFPSLHTLYLDHNGLAGAGLQPLALAEARRLRTLFLHGNQLDTLAGLGHGELRGLVLDGNRLGDEALLEAAEAGLLRHVRDLHLESNLVHGLAFLARAPRVSRLFLAKNKLAEAVDLVPLRLATHLRELGLLGNPVCLRAGPRHYALVKELLPRLALLDGHPLDAERYLAAPPATPANPSSSFPAPASSPEPTEV